MTYYSHNNGITEIDGFEGYEKIKDGKVEIEIDLPEDTFLELQKLSDRRHKPMSEVVEDILKWSMSNYEAEKKIAQAYVREYEPVRDIIEELR